VDTDAEDDDAINDIVGGDQAMNFSAMLYSQDNQILDDAPTKIDSSRDRAAED